MTDQLRIAVVGTGLMGADHVNRITTRIVGASVSAIGELDEARAKRALENAPGAIWYPNIEVATGKQLLQVGFMRRFDAGLEAPKSGLREEVRYVSKPEFYK